MDPINALQNLTNQGTRNPMPTQIMNMGNQLGMGNVNVNVNANPNVNVLQNLINVSVLIEFCHGMKMQTKNYN